MKGRKKQKNVWAEYERRKRRLSQQPQPSPQYEQKIKQITQEMKL